LTHNDLFSDNNGLNIEENEENVNGKPGGKMVDKNFKIDYVECNQTTGGGQDEVSL